MRVRSPKKCGKNKPEKNLPFSSGAIVVIKAGSKPGKILGSTGKRKQWQVRYQDDDGEFKTGIYTSGQLRHPNRDKKDKIFKEPTSKYFILLIFCVDEKFKIIF